MLLLAGDEVEARFNAFDVGLNTGERPFLPAHVAPQAVNVIAQSDLSVFQVAHISLDVCKVCANGAQMIECRIVKVVSHIQIIAKKSKNR